MSNQAKGNEKYGFLVGGICFMVFFTGTYGQYLLSPMASQVMELFQIDAQQYAMIFTTCMLPGLVLSLLSGTLCDRFGAKVTVGIALILSAVGILGRMFTTSFPVVIACMVVEGLGCMILTSTVAKILAPYFCGEKLNVAVGVVSSSNTVAMFIAMATTALLPSVQVAFTISAVLAIAVLLAWFACIKKDSPASVSPNMAPSGNDGEVSSENADVPQTASMRESLRVCFRSKGVWCAGITLMVLMTGQIALATFLPTALQVVKGFTQEGAGAISSVYMFGAIVGSVVFPKIFNMVSSKRVLATVSLILIAAGVAFAWNIPNFILMCAALFICGALLSGFVPLMFALPVMLPEIGVKYAGAAGGLSATINSIGLAIIPTYVLVPIFTTVEGLNYSGLFLAAGIIVLISIITVNATPLVKNNK